MRIEYELLDVFTTHRFAGNPLAVVPDARAIDAATMQIIAREFNLSETAFVLPGESPSRFRLRIFTPLTELPFAGHPTIGTAIALALRNPQMKQLVFEEAVGDVVVDIDKGRGTLTSPGLPVPVPTEGRDAVARILGIHESRLVAVTGWSAGVPFTCVELGRLEDLAAISLDLAAWRELLDGTEAPSLYVFAENTSGDSDLRARMFAPSMGIVEDPATGAAAAALAGQLGKGRFVIEQGVEMGRPSHIHLQVTDDQIRIGGDAVRIAQGMLTW